MPSAEESDRRACAKTKNTRQVRPRVPNHQQQRDSGLSLTRDDSSFMTYRKKRHCEIIRATACFTCLFRRALLKSSNEISLSNSPISSVTPSADKKKRTTKAQGNEHEDGRKREAAGGRPRHQHPPTLAALPTSDN